MKIYVNRFFFLFLLVFTFSEFYAQEIIITVNGTNEKALLLKIEGEKTLLIDSIKSNDSNTYTIFASEYNLQTGLYRLSFNDRKQLKFVYDRKNIDIKTHFDNLDHSIEVVNSESNRIYYEFVELNRNYKAKTDLLQLVLARYPKDDDYYKTTIDKANQLQKEYNAFIDSVVRIDPSSFISRYVRSSQLPIADYVLPIDDQIAYLKSHALDNVDFSDAELIYSDAFTNKTIEYLTYYRNPQLPKELLEKEFQKAVDTLLTKASVNILVYEQIADYLIDGFKQFGFDNIVDYIVENYVVKDDLCLDEQTENSIENRINQSKLLNVGTTAPYIILPDSSGNVVNISKIEKEKILLLFYASWCPHCQDLLPEIHELYKQRDNLEVVAISLDDNKDEWLGYLKDNSYEWVDLSDLQGWESQAAQDYYIYATPTMFLLDAQGKIIGKPITIKELSELL